MAKKVKVLVRSRVKGLSKEDEAKFKIGKVVSIDPEGEHGHLVRDGVFQVIDGAEDDPDPADAGKGDGEGGDEDPDAGKTTQRGSKLNQGGTATDKSAKAKAAAGGDK